VFGTVLFSNVDEVVDLAAIDAFLAYHHSKESSVIAVLADAYDMFDLRCEKSSVKIVCCTPTLYVWLVSHVFNHGSNLSLSCIHIYLVVTHCILSLIVFVVVVIVVVIIKT